MYALFIYDCGGDSFNHSEIQLFDKNDNLIDVDLIPNNQSLKELCDFIDNDVYSSNEFYVNSDGYYLGEHGTIKVVLLENGDEDLEVSKRYTIDDILSGDYDEEIETFELSQVSEDRYEEFSEQVVEQIDIDFTPEELELLNKYVSSFERNYSENNVEYVSDAIIPTELEVIFDKIHNTIVSELDEGLDLEDELSYSLTEDDFTETCTIEVSYFIVKEYPKE